MRQGGQAVRPCGCFIRQTKALSSTHVRAPSKTRRQGRKFNHAIPQNKVVRLVHTIVRQVFFLQLNRSILKRSQFMLQKRNDVIL